MTTTPAAIRAAMCRRDSRDFGEILPAPTSIAVGSLTFASRAVGAIPSERYAYQYHIVRPEAASVADWWRVCTAYDSSTGAFSHEGTNYADTTGTNETVQLLGFSPILVNECINHTLGRMRQLDVTEVIGIGGGGRHWMYNYDWIDRPSRVRKITLPSSPQLSRNRSFRKWNSYSSAGALQPDDWALAGTGATMARSTAQRWRGDFTVLITPGSATTTFYQDVGLAENGVAADSLRSKTVSARAVCRVTEASKVRVYVEVDGTKTYSSYHSGDSTFEELTAEVTVGSDAYSLAVGIEAAANAAAFYAGECHLDYGAIGDANRRDNYSEEIVYDYEWEQDSGRPPLHLPGALGRHYEIHSWRPYPQLDAASMASGAADAYVIDADEDLVALGALSNLYERVGATDHPKAALYRGLHVTREGQFQTALKSLGYEPDAKRGQGITFGTARRFGAPPVGRR